MSRRQPIDHLAKCRKVAGRTVNYAVANDAKSARESLFNWPGVHHLLERPASGQALNPVMTALDLRRTPLYRAYLSKAMTALPTPTAVNQRVGGFRETKRSSPGRTRTYDKAVNSRLLYQLSYRGRTRRLGRGILKSISRSALGQGLLRAGRLCRLDGRCGH